jgi:hypothetical protein
MRHRPARPVWIVRRSRFRTTCDGMGWLYRLEAPALHVGKLIVNQTKTLHFQEQMAA